MPYCPECKYEYVEGVSECPDCKTELVNEIDIPEAGPLEEVKWRKLEIQHGSVIVEMIKEALEQEGIPCILKPANLSSYLGRGTNIFGDNSHLLVPENRYDESVRIVNDISDG